MAGVKTMTLLAAALLSGCAASPAKLAEAAMATADLAQDMRRWLVRAHELSQERCMRLETEEQQVSCMRKHQQDWEALQKKWLRAEDALCDLEPAACP